MQPSRCRKFNIPCRQAGVPPKKHHLSSTANVSYQKNWFCRDTRGLLTSFLATFGVVFLNLEVLKRFMLPSQIDFRAFRVSLSSLAGTRQRAPATADSTGSARGVRSLCCCQQSDWAEFAFWNTRQCTALSRATPGVKTCTHLFTLWIWRSLALINWRWYFQFVLIEIYRRYSRRVCKHEQIILKQTSYFILFFIFLTVHHLESNRISLCSGWRPLRFALAHSVRSGSLRNNDGVFGCSLFLTLDHSYRVLWASPGRQYCCLHW